MEPDQLEDRQEQILRGLKVSNGDLSSLWAVVLAGGEGFRLRALTRRVCGDERPKQYAKLVGSRSLLRQTLDRVGPVIPLERTVVVTLGKHAPYTEAEFSGRCAPRLLAQPEDRGTAAGVLFPAHWVSWQDPQSTIAVFPSDHHIVEEAAFMRYVLEATAFVNQNPDWIVVFGIPPTDPEPEYGWIEPGPMLARTRLGALYKVCQFQEKPPAETVHEALARGWLWNSLVLVAKASTLIDVGRQALPSLHEWLSRISLFAGSASEPWAIQQAYTLAPKLDFSRHILEPCPSRLAVHPLPPLIWSDWGTPERVIRSLRRAGISPAWLATDERDHPANGSGNAFEKTILHQDHKQNGNGVTADKVN